LIDKGATFAGGVLLAISALFPAYGQYAGPAVLSRGEAPAAMSAPTIRFRPFVEVTGVYDTGLSGVTLDSSGNQLATGSSFGYGINFGVSGAHTWKRAFVGLEYHGGFTEYAGGSSTLPWTMSHSLMLGFNYRIARHMKLSLRETAGTFTRNYDTGSLAQTVPFDPTYSYVPATDYFDNRTTYATTQADLTIEKSAKTSISFGGDGFTTRRRSEALASVTGEVARADYQHRLTRSTTVGANYNYSHYVYTGIVGGTDAHSVVGSYSVRPSRNLEFSAYGGMTRVESTYVRITQVDPVIAVLLGITESKQVAYTRMATPTVGARLSRVFRSGVAYVNGGRSLSAGNGLFLASMSTVVNAGYTFTGMRRWSFAANVAMIRSDATDFVSGGYNTYTAGLSGSRALGKLVHARFSYSARRYSSQDFSLYNRWIYTATVGIAFAPGELPMRLW